MSALVWLVIYGTSLSIDAMVTLLFFVFGFNCSWRTGVVMYFFLFRFSKQQIRWGGTVRGVFYRRELNRQFIL